MRPVLGRMAAGEERTVASLRGAIIGQFKQTPEDSEERLQSGRDSWVCFRYAACAGVSSVGCSGYDAQRPARPSLLAIVAVASGVVGRLAQPFRRVFLTPAGAS